MQTTSPIFVTGMPRSGTTFMQHLLSQHPRIAIYGQEPANVDWGQWLSTLTDGLDMAQESNDQLGQDPVHYGGLLGYDETCHAFLEFTRRYLTGESPTPRWGLKSLLQCREAVPQILHVWPETRWIVCVRDPFRSFESLRNTFDVAQNHALLELANWWTEAVRFAVSHPQAKLIQFDGLTCQANRHRCVRELCEFIGEEPSPEVFAFVDRWPVVHKVIPDADRTYQLPATEWNALLDQCPAFADWCDRLGYTQRGARPTGLPLGSAHS